LEWLVVGLGNPGARYAGTRHNIGRAALQALVGRPAAEWTFERKAEGLVFSAELLEAPVTYLLPETFMNRSGRSVRRFLSYRPAGVELVVVHDDLDLPLGRLRISQDRGAGGHKGVTSIITELGRRDFIRLRLGVGRSAGPTADFVLESFEPTEKEEVDRVLALVPAVLKTIVKEGAPAAMTKYNSG
jgi:PTH1 family peptidyl-tRNA hydrolase